MIPVTESFLKQIESTIVREDQLLLRNAEDTTATQNYETLSSYSTSLDEEDEIKPEQILTEKTETARFEKALLLSVAYSCSLGGEFIHLFFSFTSSFSN